MNPFRWLFPILLLLAAPVSAAEAAEYRLQVVSLYEEAFTYYLEPGNGSLARLESALDRETIPKSVVLYDRWVRPAERSVARAFGAHSVKAEPIADRAEFLPVYRWQGEPGVRTVWELESRNSYLHELMHLGLKGTGVLRHVLPERVTFGAQRSMALGFPTHFLDSWEDRPGLWERWLLPRLDLNDGIAAVIGVRSDPSRPNRVYLVVQPLPTSESFKVVLGWRHRPGTLWLEGLGGEEPR